MRRTYWELVLLVLGLALSVVLVEQTTLASVNHPTAWFTYGFPFVWKTGGSASPLYVYLPALLEDISFWLVLSLALVELPVRFVVINLHHRLNRSDGPSPNPGGQLTRASIIIASAVVVAALLISASTFATIGGPVTTTLTLTTTSTTTIAQPQPPITSIVATTTSTLTEVSTSTATVTAIANCPQSATCASFTYLPLGPMVVVSVESTEYTCQNCGAVNGQSYLSLAVTVENAGNATLYILGGTSELSSSVPSNSTVIHEVPSVVCAGTTTIVELGKGQNYTLYGPSCDDGYVYQLVQPGIVSISFGFVWGSNGADLSNSTRISAQFGFA